MIGRFDGGRITSDGGGLLLREVDQRIGLLDRLAACFTDHRNPESIEHSVRDLRQRGSKVGIQTRRPVIGRQVRSSNELAKLLRSAW
ncbi:transposase [Thiolapillus sp.]|uniref:transposase n=1 Tax=Thiolapillus sp. TaxID=2017437 RepID=UPI003AF77877